MGRHRNTGIPRAQQAALLASGAFTSHRRVRNPSRARAASALAVGILATGAVITATNIPWLQDASLPQSRAETPARPDDHRGPPAGPGASAPAAPLIPVVAPAAAPSAPPESPAPTASPATLWRADDPGAFRPAPRNTVGAPPPQVDGGHVSVRLTGRGQRSELEPALPAVQEGDQHDVVVSLLLGRDFPVLGPGHHVIARWENDGPGPAPLDLRVRDGELVLHGGEGHPSGWRTFDQPLGPVPTGQWCQVGVRVCFSANPDKAAVSASRDGLPVLTDHRPRGGTLYPGQQSHLRVGLHRDAGIAEPAAVHLRDLRVARTHATTTAPSVPQQRTSNSGTSVHRSAGPRSVEHRSVEHPSAPPRSVGRESVEHGSTERRVTDHRSSEHRSTAAATSHRTDSHGSVPRNTPSHVTTRQGGSTGARR